MPKVYHVMEATGINIMSTGVSTDAVRSAAEVLANYFGLVTPGGPEGRVMLITLPLWFLSLRTIWRAKLFERFLAIDDRE